MSNEVSSNKAQLTCNSQDNQIEINKVDEHKEE